MPPEHALDTQSPESPKSPTAPKLTGPTKFMDAFVVSPYDQQHSEDPKFSENLDSPHPDSPDMPLDTRNPSEHPKSVTPPNLLPTCEVYGNYTRQHNKIQSPCCPEPDAIDPAEFQTLPRDPPTWLCSMCNLQFTGQGSYTLHNQEFHTLKRNRKDVEQPSALKDEEETQSEGSDVLFNVDNAQIPAGYPNPYLAEPLSLPYRFSSVPSQEKESSSAPGSFKSGLKSDVEKFQKHAAQKIASSRSAKSRISASASSHLKCSRSEDQMHAGSGIDSKSDEALAKDKPEIERGPNGQEASNPGTSDRENAAILGYDVTDGENSDDYMTDEEDSGEAAGGKDSNDYGDFENQDDDEDDESEKDGRQEEFPEEDDERESEEDSDSETETDDELMGSEESNRNDDDDGGEGGTGEKGPDGGGGCQEDGGTSRDQDESQEQDRSRGDQHESQEQDEFHGNDGNQRERESEQRNEAQAEQQSPGQDESQGHHGSQWQKGTYGDQGEVQERNEPKGKEQEAPHSKTKEASTTTNPIADSRCSVTGTRPSGKAGSGGNGNAKVSLCFSSFFEL